MTGTIATWWVAGALAFVAPAADEAAPTDGVVPPTDAPAETAAAGEKRPDDDNDPLKNALIEDAKKHFETGNRLSSEKRFAEAAAAFRRSYDAVPREATLWNEAVAWQAAGERIQALEAYDRYLSLPDCVDGGPKLCAAERGEATKNAQKLRGQVGELEIVLEPGADISGVEVEGEFYPLTAFPMYAEPGEMEVFVVGAGEGQRRRRVAGIEAGQRTSLLIAPFGKKVEDDNGDTPIGTGDPEQTGRTKDPALRRKRLRIAFYSTLGATVASGIALGVVGGLLADAHADFERRCKGVCGASDPVTGGHDPGEDAYPLQERRRFEQLQPAWTGMLIVTSGLALTSIALAVFAFSKGDRAGQNASTGGKTGAKPTALFTGNGVRIRW